MHDWGAAGGRPGGQTGEQRGQQLRAQSDAGADCAAAPRQVSPPSSSVSPGQTLGSEAGALPSLDPTPLSERQNASWISPNWSWTPLWTLPPYLSPFTPPLRPPPFSQYIYIFFLRSKESTGMREKCQDFLVIIFFPRGSQAERKVLGSLN